MRRKTEAGVKLMGCGTGEICKGRMEKEIRRLISGNGKAEVGGRGYDIGEDDWVKKWKLFGRRLMVVRRRFIG